MLIGRPEIFAIESGITVAYESLGMLAWGYFAIHVGGRVYGVREPDATLLACSFGGVGDRLAACGRHTAPFSTEPDAAEIANAFRSAIYAEEQEDSYFGLSLSDFSNYFSMQFQNLVWAPDGDEAFDDSSYVLQFDVQDRVRLIAFKCTPDSRHDPLTLADVWLPADVFYLTLAEWHEAFDREWRAAPKSVEFTSDT